MVGGENSKTGSDSNKLDFSTIEEDGEDGEDEENEENEENGTMSKN